MSRALSLFPQGSHCLYDTREVSTSNFFPFFLRGIWDASSFVPSVFSAGRFQGMFTQRDSFLSLLNAFRNGCVGGLGIPSAPNYWNVPCNLKCFPLTAPKNLLKQSQCSGLDQSSSSGWCDQRQSWQFRHQIKEIKTSVCILKFIKGAGTAGSSMKPCVYGSQ